MKISRLEAITILLCAVCLSFTAGWFLRGDVSAQPVRVETQRTLSEEEAVVILPSPSAEPAPTASDVPAETAPAETAPAESVSSPQPSASAAQQTEKININTADAATLDLLPGIGEKRAQDIIDYRNANGPFRVPEDLTRVSGIGEGILEGLIDYITVE